MKPYSVIYNPDGQRDSLRRQSDMVCIPLDPRNTDYQEFLRLVDELGESAVLEI